MQQYCTSCHQILDNYVNYYNHQCNRPAHIAGQTNICLFSNNQTTEVTRGYNFIKEPLKLQKEICSVYCRNCNNIWQEEIEHYGVIVGWARTYDRCSKCYNPNEAKHIMTPQEKAIKSFNEQCQMSEANRRICELGICAHEEHQKN